jgi:glutathione S-transferase
MIRLFQFPPTLRGTPNASPFCVKLECALRLQGVAYDIAHVPEPSAGPKHKVPFAEIDGERIGDSTLILDLLKARQGLDLDRGLDARAQAESHALQRMIEERLYWVMVYSRWAEPQGWDIIRPLFFAALPAPMRAIVPRLARRAVLKKLDGHGIGRHTRAEIYAFGARDLAALAAILGEKPFLFGDAPTLADATLFGFLVNIIGPDVPSPLKDAALAHRNLVAHTERMGELFAAKRPLPRFKAAA